MPTTATKQGITLPTYGDPPQIPADLLRLWDDTISRAIPRYASTAQRDTEWTSPTAGQVCFTSDTGTWWGRIGTSWVPIFRTNGVYRREVLTGTDVITPASGVSFGSRLAVIDHGSDGTRTVSLLVAGVNVPYSSTTPSTSVWGTVNAALRPVDDASAQFTHPTNVGLGWIKSTGELAMRWGTFSTTGSTSVRCAATYPLPAL